MKQWKQILMNVLWILTRLDRYAERMERPPVEDNHGVRIPAKKAKRADESAKLPTDMVPTSLMTNVSRNVAAPAAVTFGPKSSGLLPRSRVLSLLHSDCRASTRRVNLLVVHCSDTRPDQNYSFEQLLRDHRRRGFGQYPGYHLFVRRDGTLFYCRPVRVAGCHVSGWNKSSVAICYEGGHSMDAAHPYEDNRTAEQLVVMHEVLSLLHEVWPEARIVGHNELNPNKACPCFKASHEYKYISPHPPALPPNGGRE